MCTYERGWVTLAAAAPRLTGLCASAGKDVRPCDGLPGKGMLDITIQADGHVCMSGPAVRIMEGEMII
ncbi:MAG: hypothetical protein ACLVJ6_04660 [Merdibacter sp.]